MKKQGEIVSVQTRVTQDINRLNGITHELDSLYSSDFMNTYRDYCFNYSCLEAKHLGIAIPGETLEDKAVFNKLCRFRLEVLMDELLAFTYLGASSENSSEVDFAKSAEPCFILPTEMEIKTQIADRYNGDKKNLKNFRTV
jgi:hypothetical protein